MLIDGLGPDGVAAVTRDLSRQASRFQSGYLYHYAFVMLIGLVVCDLVPVPALAKGNRRDPLAAALAGHVCAADRRIFIRLRVATRQWLRRNARFIALRTSLAVFALSVLLWVYFDPNTAAFQFVERANWITLGGFTISYHMGIDGISLFFILLSTLLTFLSILSSWVVIRFHVREYMIAFLVLETFMVGIFCSLDFILFYVFFEGVLVPMFVIIGVWGGENRIYPAFKFFFLHHIAGFGADAVGDPCNLLQTGSTDIEYALNHANLFSFGLQKWLWLAFFASFAIKVPMWPLHTWLPDAHVEAPTAGSVILAGILLKLGGYGFCTVSRCHVPLASHFFTPLIFTLSVIAVIHTSLVALAQTDMKKLIAYSSIAHMGFVTMGIFAVTAASLQGVIRR